MLSACATIGQITAHRRGRVYHKPLINRPPVSFTDHEWMASFVAFQNRVRDVADLPVPPLDLCCPLSHRALLIKVGAPGRQINNHLPRVASMQPVTLVQTECTFEKSRILAFMRRHGKCPVTGQHLAHWRMRKNTDMLDSVKQWR